MVSIPFSLKRKSSQIELVDAGEKVEHDELSLTLSQPHESVGGINIIRMIQDHGLGQLAELDAEIDKSIERTKALMAQRVLVLKLVRVLDGNIGNDEE
jgi:hypothetical protein